MRPVFHSLGHMFIVLISAKSNDITNMYLKSIIVQKIAFSSIFDIIISPDYFEIKSKDIHCSKYLKEHLILFHR